MEGGLSRGFWQSLRDCVQAAAVAELCSVASEVVVDLLDVTRQLAVMRLLTK
jgi:hypothetical protein